MTMQIRTRRPYLAPFTDYVSEHRFRLVMALCLVALAIMLGAIYGTIGFGPIWAVPTVPSVI
jgi:hypothetical protein